MGEQLPHFHCAGRQSETGIPVSRAVPQGNRATRFMIEAKNNVWVMEMVEISTAGRFLVGEILFGRSYSNDWWVHWRDETTLLVAPTEMTPGGEFKKDPPPPTSPLWKAAHIFHWVNSQEPHRKRIYQFSLTARE